MPKPVYSKSTKLALLYKREADHKLNTLDDAPPTEWAGSTDAKLAVITSVYIGRSEEKRLLYDTFKKLHITAADVYLTTATKQALLRHHADGVDAIETRSVNKSEIETLRPFLLHELAIIRPQTVICLGSNSSKVLFGDSKFSVTKDRGRELITPAVPAHIFTTFSPHYVLLKSLGKLDTFERRTFLADIAEAFHHSKLDLHAPDAGSDWED